MRELSSGAAHLLAAAPRLDSLGHASRACDAREQAQRALQEMESIRGVPAPPVVKPAQHPRKCRPLVHSDSEFSLFQPDATASRALVGMNQEVLAHIASIPVQLQRDEVQKIRGARRLFALMTSEQIRRVTGAQVGELDRTPPLDVLSSFTLTVIKRWGADSLNGFARRWEDITRFSEASGRRPFRGVFSGSFVQAYQQHVDARARRRASGSSAGGVTALGGSGSQIRTLANDLHFPIEVASVASRVATKRKRRKSVHHVPFTERALLKLCRVASMPTLPVTVRMRAAGVYAMSFNALRHKSAKRFRILASPPPTFSPSGGVVRGLVLIDPKTSVDEGLSACCPAHDLEGNRAWLDLLVAMQSKSVCKCIVYDDDSPTGNPFEALEVFDAASSRGRSVVALNSILRSDVCSPSFTHEQLHGRTPHSCKGVLPTIARCAGEPQPVQNEIGKWDGSEAQSFADPTERAARQAGNRDSSDRNSFPILENYTSVGAEDEYIPALMERQVERMRRRVREVLDEDLPAVGGFAWHAGRGS